MINRGLPYAGPNPPASVLEYYEADPGRHVWREQHQPPAAAGQLRQELAEREPALRHWIRAFDTAGYLASNGLTGQDIGALKALLRP